MAILMFQGVHDFSLISLSLLDIDLEDLQNLVLYYKEPFQFLQQLNKQLEKLDHESSKKESSMNV